jgi:hypothetical protein
VLCSQERDTLPHPNEMNPLHILTSVNLTQLPDKSWQLTIVNITSLEYTFGLFLAAKTGASNIIGKCNWTFCCVFSQDSSPLHTSSQFKEGGWLCRTNVENCFNFLLSAVYASLFMFVLFLIMYCYFVAF